MIIKVTKVKVTFQLKGHFLHSNVIACRYNCSIVNSSILIELFFAHLSICRCTSNNYLFCFNEYIKVITLFFLFFIQV